MNDEQEAQSEAELMLEKYTFHPFIHIHFVISLLSVTHSRSWQIRDTYHQNSSNPDIQLY